MAYLTFTGSEEKQNTCFKFIGANSNYSTGLISDNTSLISENTSLISSDSECMDTCSFYSGPDDSTIVAFAESNVESDYSFTGESCGSIAYSGVGETCGSVASSSCFSSSSAGGCSYSC